MYADSVQSPETPLTSRMYFPCQGKQLPHTFMALTALERSSLQSSHIQVQTNKKPNKLIRMWIRIEMRHPLDISTASLERLNKCNSDSTSSQENALQNSRMRCTNTILITGWVLS
ncbi:hypothetical protein F2P81_000631 [Scophthalmus maximus]|uniref:Uncharacterized protein n=1 Tax=Scophthalmus maximus TaxID=52904 RepID=A0A6A4TRK1_SCOMX|nr:hypothetical protein F2P81_000631 [Scophthalmus maximus]